MHPVIISPAIQDFNGLRYWRDGKYFKSRAGDRLHRAVWSAFWGPIPSTCLIHHIDEDTANNRLDNLQCLSRVAHMQHHRADLYRRQVPIICIQCGAPCMVAASHAARTKVCSKSCGDRHGYLRRKAFKLDSL
jgi:hypothetical protein